MTESELRRTSGVVPASALVELPGFELLGCTVGVYEISQAPQCVESRPGIFVFRLELYSILLRECQRELQGIDRIQRQLSVEQAIVRINIDRGDILKIQCVNQYSSYFSFERGLSAHGRPIS